MITLLIDGNGLGYRAHHSTGSLDSGIVFGFLTTVLQLSERYRTNQFIFCWDSTGSIRKKIFPAYKASRDTKTPEERAERNKIHDQFDALQKHILPALGFNNQPYQNGYEADDIIAWLVVCVPNKSFIVVSSDHDLFQLLQYHNCKGQHQFSSGSKMTASKFMAEYRIPARDWATIKAIAGCPGDGVIGVPGVGESTAIKYLLDELPDGKKRRDIAEAERSKLVLRNYKLVRLPFPGIEPINLAKDSIAEDVVFTTLSDLGFTSFLSGEQSRRWERLCRGEWK